MTLPFLWMGSDERFVIIDPKNKREITLWQSLANANYDGPNKNKLQ